MDVDSNIFISAYLIDLVLELIERRNCTPLFGLSDERCPMMASHILNIFTTLVLRVFIFFIYYFNTLYTYM